MFVPPLIWQDKNDEKYYHIGLGDVDECIGPFDTYELAATSMANMTKNCKSGSCEE